MSLYMMLVFWNEMEEQQPISRSEEHVKVKYNYKINRYRDEGKQKSGRDL